MNIRDCVNFFSIVFDSSFLWLSRSFSSFTGKSFLIPIFLYLRLFLTPSVINRIESKRDRKRQREGFLDKTKCTLQNKTNRFTLTNRSSVSLWEDEMLQWKDKISLRRFIFSRQSQNLSKKNLPNKIRQISRRQSNAIRLEKSGKIKLSLGWCVQKSGRLIRSLFLFFRFCDFGCGRCGLEALEEESCIDHETRCNSDEPVHE